MKKNKFITIDFDYYSFKDLVCKEMWDTFEDKPIYPEEAFELIYKKMIKYGLIKKEYERH